MSTNDSDNTMTKPPIPTIIVYILFIRADLSTSDLSTSCDSADEGPSKQENIHCVLYQKRILTCHLRDNVQRKLTTCTTCSQTTELQTPNDTCPNVVSGLECTTSVGKCVYDCDSLRFCDYYHMVKVTLTGSDDTEAVSMCRQIRTEDYIQPGPVRNLSVTAINSTTLQVSWKKPNDRYRYYDKYRYTVKYGNEKTRRVKTKDEDIDVVLSDLVPRGNYNVTVWARPSEKGFCSPPQTVSTLFEEEMNASSSDATRESEMKTVLIVVFAASSTALIALATVFLKKRIKCERMAITLPKMMPFPAVYEESGTSFVQVPRRCRNEAGFSAKKGDLCKDGPRSVTGPNTDVPLECEIQEQDCGKTSTSGSCSHGNDVKSDDTSGDKPELIETWSCSTDSRMSAYSYRLVTVGSGCPRAVYHS